MEWMQKRNSLSLEMLRLKENYVKQMKEFERIFDDYRFNFSKTKAIIGFSNVTFNHIDLREMEPTTMPNEDKEMMPEQLFNLVLSETSEKSDIDGPRKRINKREPLNTEESLPEDSEGKLKPLFRPFGVLEPNSAKIVRRNIYATFPILCDLANLSAEIKSIHQKIKKMDKIKE